MLLAAGAVSEIISFIQVLCWIILPVLALAILLTVFLHYRKKRKNEAEALPAEELLPVPATLLQGKKAADYILFDHSGLVDQYHNRLCQSQAKYTALRHDFSRLETKYTALALYASNHTYNPKEEEMENSALQLNPAIQEEIDWLIKKHKAEKQEWKEKNDQLAHSYRSLEQENNLLQAKLELATATEEGKESIVNKWAEENSILKDKLAEHDYLSDIVEEKKSQIIFLQNQLEQKIVLQHAAEYQTSQSQAELAGKEELLQQKEQLLQEKHHEITVLQGQLAAQQEILHATAKKLSACKQLTQRFYEEFSRESAGLLTPG